ncbi:hypothetical protein HDU91_007279 [Kappamyces sp. JEL0680]|nr:hypothetical protein HDU91_007279 [Kappamyces sp. JEL0680]
MSISVPSRLSDNIFYILFFAILWQTVFVAANSVFGQSNLAESIFNVSTGYFVWDLCHCVYYHKLIGMAFTFHAVTGLFLMLGLYNPLFQYFGGAFLFFEISTIFVNFHWFSDKLGLAGTWIQIVNGICLVTAFALVRIGYGSAKIYEMLTLGWQNLNKGVPLGWYCFYCFACVGLQLLNLYWFRTMVASLVRRVSQSFKRSRQDSGVGLKLD